MRRALEAVLLLVACVVGPLVPGASARAVVAHVPYDFDGDGRADVSVFRPSSATWFVHTAPAIAVAYGAAGDTPVPGDYDGDGKTDIAVVRPSTGTWFEHLSSGGDTALTYGVRGDVPAPADYDGDGKADVAVFRTTTGTWFVHRSSGGDTALTFGIGGDIPVPADYDGDGKADLAVFRPSTATWFVHRSSGDTALNYGVPGDVAVVADYDGDGRSDAAIYRPATGLWAVHRSGGGDSGSTYGGVGGDIPVPADYDGDGKADLAVNRPILGAWYVNASATATDTATTWGIPADVPLPLSSAVSGWLAPAQLSSDPYTNPTSAHRTEVEPDTFSSGPTIVSAFQVGRFADGGSSNIGWATSTDAGATWSSGFLPGTTVFAGGSYDRVSDPSVAFDPAHGQWLVGSLALAGASSPRGAAILVSRSADGGRTWSNPVAVATTATGDLDKGWVACDGTPSSPFYGRCYVEWDDHGNANLIQMSTSTDGGATWGAPRATANAARGLGGQPLVKPDGTVVVPIDDLSETNLLSFVSTDGGASWGSTVTVATITDRTVAGGLRAGPLPSAEMDASGRTYLVWQDCRFRAGCPSNDIVMSTSTDGLTWSAVARVPIDAVGSGADHFIPGIGVDRTTSGASARLGVTYYFYPSASCTAATCQLSVGFVASGDGGTTWGPATQLARPMSLGWLPSTTEGAMVGDYVSTSWAGGYAHAVVAIAGPPSGSTFDQTMYTVSRPAPNGPAV